MAETEEDIARKYSGFVLDPEKCSQLNLGEKLELVHEIAQWPEDAPRILSSFSRRELLEIICSEMERERKYTGMSKGRMIDLLLNAISANRKKRNINTDDDLRPVKINSGAKRQKGNENSNHPSDNLDTVGTKKHVDGPVKFPQCQNFACRATLRAEDGFCRRCSCCICHSYDDNKDPSLWLTCTSDPPYETDSCGLSCHLKCALKHDLAGILKNSRKLDGQFCCTSCGKVNDLMSTWRKQLLIAKEARRVDVLCMRISLCHKILDGTKLYKDLQKFVDTAAKKLKKELGPLDRVCAKMGRGIVNRLACGPEVQKLCFSALDAYNNSFTNLCLHPRVQKKSPTCRIHFAETDATSVMVILEYEDHPFQNLLGCRIWHRKSDSKSYPDKPTCIVLKPEKKFKISGLRPSTEYMCRVSLCSCSQIFGTWEAKWLTLPPKAPNPEEVARFEYCVNAVKSLEREGHLSSDFLAKFPTWYSLDATDRQRRAVSTFVEVMGNDPPSLAAQLIDAFEDEISGIES